jgi:hypothetical protein
MNKTRTRTATYVSDMVCMRLFLLLRVSWTADAVPWIHPNTPLSGTCRVHSAAQDALRVTRATAERSGTGWLPGSNDPQKPHQHEQNWDLNQPNTNQVEKVRGDKRFRRFVRNGKGND